MANARERDPIINMLSKVENDVDQSETPGLDTAAGTENKPAWLAERPSSG
jgi:hypothetical protein